MKFLDILLVNLQYTDFNGTTQVLQLNICFSVLLNWPARLHLGCVHSSHRQQDLDQTFRDKLQLIILTSRPVLDSFSSSAKLLLKITGETSTIRARGGRSRHFASSWLDSVLPDYSFIGGKPSPHDYYSLRTSHKSSTHPPNSSCILWASAFLCCHVNVGLTHSGFHVKLNGIIHKSKR